MNKNRKWLDGWQIISLIVLLYFIVFFVYPLFVILAQSIWNSTTNSFDFSNFVTFFTEKFFLNTLKNSLNVSVLVTLIATVIGGFLAYITRTIKIKFKTIIDLLLMISIISPPFLGAYSWIILLGRTGIITTWLNSTFNIAYQGIYGFDGIVLVFSIKMIPLVYLYVSGALKNVDNSLIEASEGLGRHGARKFFTVILPLVLPTLLASGILVFMRVLSDFATPQLIGEGYRTLPVLIYNTFTSDVVTNRPLAATIAVVIIFITVVMFLLQKWFSERKTIEMTALRPIEAKKARGLLNVFAHTLTYIVTLIAILPTFVITANSFLSSRGRVLTGDFTFINYINAFKVIAKPLRNTLIYSFIALAIVIIIGIVISFMTVRRKSKLSSSLDIISMLPYIIPGSVLGISLLLSFNKKPLAFAGTAIIIVLAFSIRRLPYAIRSTTGILHQIDRSVDEASESLGANKFKTFFKVTLPLMWNGILSGAILSWLSIITEISATIVLYTFRTKTLSIEIFLKVQDGEYGIASSLASLLMVVTIITLILSLKLSGKKEVSL